MERSAETPGADPDSLSPDGHLTWASLGALSSCGIAYLTEGRADGADRAVNSTAIDGPMWTTYTLAAKPGMTYEFDQLTAMVSDQLNHQPGYHAIRVVSEAARRGFETLRQENRTSWQALWGGRVCLLGADERWQRFADAAFYYLHASVHAASVCSTSLFGLARWHNYHYYFGHPMWDLETFCLPVLSVTAPDAAEAMLDYRFLRLDAARANAQSWGYRGAQFPWESSLLRGEEVAPGVGSGAAFEQHVTLDVALGFARHAQVSGDPQFLAERAWPVLREVSRWLESRVERTARGYEIRRANGPAERKQPADNNAYVNMAAKRVLELTASAARILGVSVPEAWAEIRAGLVLPLAEDGTRLVSHDGFRPDEEQADAPEPLAGVFPVGYRLSPGIAEHTLRAYLASEGGSYIGSPMLSPLYGVWGARLGDRALAGRLYERGYGDFIQQPYLETDEVSDRKAPEHPRVGPFFANLGGFLLGCLFGLTRLEPAFCDPHDFATGTAVMPDLWDGIEVERIWIRGRPMSLRAVHGQRAVLTPL